jgi:hypothetical protein
MLLEIAAIGNNCKQKAISNQYTIGAMMGILFSSYITSSTT